MSTATAYLTVLGNLVPGTMPLTTADKTAAISAAVIEHSRNRPRVVVEDVTGDGGFDYELADLAAYTAGFSTVRQVEYPVAETLRQPNILIEDDWVIYPKPAGDYLRLLQATPTAAYKIRITYTALHTLTAQSGTIPAHHDTAVQTLAAAIFCHMLAAYYSQSEDGIIAADSVQHSNRAREYAIRAKTYRGIYYDLIGAEEGKAPAVSITSDQDLHIAGGMDRLTHPARYR